MEESRKKVSSSFPGGRWQKLRIEMNLTQEEFGRPAGVTQYRISRLEKGARMTKTEALAMQSARGINHEWTLFDEGEPFKYSEFDSSDVTRKQLLDLLESNTLTNEERTIIELARGIGLTGDLLRRIRSTPVLMNRARQLFDQADGKLISREAETADRSFLTEAENDLNSPEGDDLQTDQDQEFDILLAKFKNMGPWDLSEVQNLIGIQKMERLIASGRLMRDESNQSIQPNRMAIIVSILKQEVE